MSDVFTLEDLDKTLEEQYGPLVFKAGREEFKLRTLLRLDKTERDAVQARLAELDGEAANADEGDVEEVFDFILGMVVGPEKAARFLEVLGGDLLRKKVLFEKWVEKTQPGEAQPSSS